MGKGSGAPLFVAGLLVVLAVAGATFGVVQVLDLDEDDVEAGAGDSDTSGTAPVTEATAVLRADQIEVTGIATGITVEGATFDRLDAPLIVEGGGATLHDVEVDGQLTDVVWDGGRPFDLQGDGGLVPQELNLFAAPAAITIGFLDEVVNELVPGSYGLETPVAIGRGGLAVAQDAVAFRATIESTVVFRGGATTSILPKALSFEAGGRVVLTGSFDVRRPDGTTAEAAGVELPDGAFRLTATPQPGGYDVEVLLQGPVAVT